MEVAWIPLTGPVLSKYRFVRTGKLPHKEIKEPKAKNGRHDIMRTGGHKNTSPKRKS